MTLHAAAELTYVPQGVTARLGGPVARATITAEYEGGAYVDLFFGAHVRASEVINVSAVRPINVDSLAAVLREWIDAQDAEEAAWELGYEDGEDRPEAVRLYQNQHPRAWLRDYLANA